MLKKLLKYDLKDIYKVLIIFYIISFVFAILTRIFFSMDNSTLFNILGYIASGTLISMIINILINNLMRTWSLFVKTVYGDQSYLTHTLPIPKKTIYLSKFLSSIITMFSSVIVIFACLFIAYYSNDVLLFIKNSLNILSSIYDSNIILLLFVIVFIFFLEMVFAVQCGFMGIILGHRANNKRIIKSILYGFGCYIGFQILILIMLFIFGLFNNQIMDLFVTNSIIDFDIIKLIMYGSVIVYILYIFVTFILNKKFFEKGVNVD
ncbi:MAG: hypothetical protein IJZ46_01060 [Bacilli bacterium]|nr:hypothetical protein [Bacilli bacterium]